MDSPYDLPAYYTHNPVLCPAPITPYPVPHYSPEVPIFPRVVFPYNHFLDMVPGRRGGGGRWRGFAKDKMLGPALGVILLGPPLFVIFVRVRVISIEPSREGVTLRTWA